MKVLFLISYYKPELTSAAHLWEDIRRELAKAGHTMELYAPTPTREVSDEVRRAYAKHRRDETELDGALRVHRFPLFREGKNSLGRAFRYGILEIQHLWFALRAKEVDVLHMGSTPPINGLMATLVSKWKKIPYVFTIQDLFPESLVSTGMTKKGSLLWTIGSWVSDVTYRNAAHIIVISESMKETLVAKGVPEEKISVIYNWTDTVTTKPVAKEENPLFEEFGLSREHFHLVYGGNLGNSQNVGILVDCAEKLKEYKDIRIVIFGGGSGKETLEKRIAESGLDNIHLFPLQPTERVSQVYSLGDASFVICKKGVGQGAFPGKTASILATGTPIVASFDLDSDLCRVIRDHRVGVCADGEDADGLCREILRLYEDRALRETVGANARALACTEFSKERAVSKTIAVLEAVGIGRAGTVYSDK